MKPSVGNVPIIDLQVQYLPPGVEEAVTLPKEAFRDRASLDAWPSKGVVNHLFAEAAGRNHDAASLTAEFDAWGICHALVPVTLMTLEATVASLGQASGRFSFTLRVDPHGGMDAVRGIEEATRKCAAIRAVHIPPHQLYPPIPPNSKEYYPIYAKCIDLGLPVMINVGFPGPRIPAWCQNPMYLDEVLWFFPELKVIMKHGGEPWVDECIKIVGRWPNAYFMMSGFTPSKYPEALMDFASRKRGRGKVMFAGYWPRLSYDKVIPELSSIGMEGNAFRQLCFENARDLFGLEV